ncbi:Zinc finger protein MAGPIE [Morus notabilis]|uniref:Zinc finger protein MAGPIE n=2 Tax=Morus notabilis TaxID=981085 RepID=W9R8A0_9ROSA|nr:Zinc finger protein MAGPIE [Morus notabilis]
MATNRFVCEICNKGFQRDQNLQLHRRGHNLPWKLRQRTTTETKKRVYICPEPTCVHHNPARALGDLTGIKKHFSRKHGEKKWKCDKCSKKYAVQSDWKAHQKTCGTREYKCDCGTIFSRRDSFITHRAFCDALAEENNKVNQGLTTNNNVGPNDLHVQMPDQLMPSMPMMSTTTTTTTEFLNNTPTTFDPKSPLKPVHPGQDLMPLPFKSMINMAAAGSGMFSSTSPVLFGSPKSISSASSNLQLCSSNSPGFTNYLQDSKNGCTGQSPGSAHMSATALLQKAAQMGATASSSTMNSPMTQKSFVSSMAGPDHHLSAGNVYDHQRHHQTNLVGINGHGFSNTRSSTNTTTTQQEMSQMFDPNTSGGSMANHDHNLGINMYGQILMGSGGGLELQEENGTNNNNNSSVVLQGKGGLERSPSTGASRFGRGGGDRIVVDFMGIGESRGASSLHEQQRLDQLEAMRSVQQQQQRLPIINHINPFHQHQQQQQLSHGDSIESWTRP